MASYPRRKMGFRRFFISCNHSSGLLLNFPCINIYVMLGKFLCRLLMCSCTLVLRLVMYMQYGHFRWGCFPHSSLKCRLRLAFHVYTFWHLWHGKHKSPVFCTFIFAIDALLECAVLGSWLLVNQFCEVCPRSEVTCDTITGFSSLIKYSPWPNTLAPSVRTGTNISHRKIIHIYN